MAFQFFKRIELNFTNTNTTYKRILFTDIKIHPHPLDQIEKALKPHLNAIFLSYIVLLKTIKERMNCA